MHCFDVSGYDHVETDSSTSRGQARTGAIIQLGKRKRIRVACIERVNTQQLSARCYVYGRALTAVHLHSFVEKGNSLCVLQKLF
jgi:hypothetical protein